MGLHEIKLDTTFKTTPDKVWAVLSDPKKFPKWVPHVTSVETKGKLTVGSEFVLKAKTTNHNMSTRAKVTELEPNKAIAWDHVEELLDGEPFDHVEETQQRFTLKAEGKGTRLGYHASFIAKSLKAKLGAKILIATKLKPEMEKALDDLKDLVE